MDNACIITDVDQAEDRFSPYYFEFIRFTKLILKQSSI